eukprot:GSChrysophyteH1.ASY1.ANO1.1124.1 assembled CDS
MRKLYHEGFVAVLCGCVFLILIDICINIGCYTNLGAYPVSASPGGQEMLARYRLKTHGSTRHAQHAGVDERARRGQIISPSEHSTYISKINHRPHRLFAALDRNYKRYDVGSTLVPAWILTDSSDNYIHRFFDSCPMSPSGRYIALTRLPDLLQQQMLRPSHAVVDHSAKVVVLDLEEGREVFSDKTDAWAAQLGAQVQWGASDEQLMYNGYLKDSAELQCTTASGSGLPIGYSLNVPAKHLHRLKCPVYHISPDGKRAAAPEMDKIKHTQYGYGVDYISCKNPSGDYDGCIYVTNIAANTCTCVASLKDLAKIAGIDRDRPIYGFHTKWSPDSEYLMVVLRSLEEPDGLVDWFLGRTVRRQHLFVLREDSSAIRDKSWLIKHVDSWSSGEYSSSGGSNHGSRELDGNHPNWVQPAPTAQTGGSPIALHRISMNKQANEDKGPHSKFKWNIVVYDIDALFTDTSGVIKPVERAKIISYRGSGHPTVYADPYTGVEKHILIDAYAKESEAFDEERAPAPLQSRSEKRDVVPLRVVDVASSREIWVLQAPLSTDSDNEGDVKSSAPDIDNSYGFSSVSIRGAVSNSGLSKDDLNSKKHRRAWRCDMHPVRCGSKGEWVVFNSRAEGKNRQVILAYLGSQWEEFFSD